MHRLSKPVFIILALAGVVAPAQEKAQEKDPIFTTDAQLVVLHATVVDARGKLIPNLPKDAFTVLENGVTQPLKTFRREDVPVSMGLIIDSSGSMRDKRQKVTAAALALVKASNPQDEVFIVNFNDEAYLDQPFTSDMKKLEEALSKIDSRGGTAMRDAVSMSIDYMREKAKKDKKVLLVVTDGDDTTSSPANTLEKLVAKAHTNEMLIYCMGILSEEERGKAKRAQRAMNSLSTASGGAAYFPKELTEVEQLAVQMAHEIRNQYVLAYTPVNQALDGSFRKIQVTAKGPGRPIVRTRSGYYATRDQKAPSRVPVPPTANSLK